MLSHLFWKASATDRLFETDLLTHFRVSKILTHAAQEAYTTFHRPHVESGLVGPQEGHLWAYGTRLWHQLVSSAFLLSAGVLQGVFRFFFLVVSWAFSLRDYLLISGEPSMTGCASKLLKFTDLGFFVWPLIASGIRR